jgi:hypothetical protein
MNLGPVNNRGQQPEFPIEEYDPSAFTSFSTGESPKIMPQALKDLVKEGKLDYDQDVKFTFMENVRQKIADIKWSLSNISFSMPNLSVTCFSKFFDMFRKSTKVEERPSSPVEVSIEEHVAPQKTLSDYITEDRGDNLGKLDEAVSFFNSLEEDNKWPDEKPVPLGHMRGHQLLDKLARETYSALEGAVKEGNPQLTKEQAKKYVQLLKDQADNDLFASGWDHLAGLVEDKSQHIANVEGSPQSQSMKNVVEAFKTAQAMSRLTDSDSE